MNSTFTFDLIDVCVPEEVIRKSLEQIGEATRNYVVGVVAHYSGEIYSYTKPIGFVAAMRSIQTSGTVDVDIQDELGDLSNESHRYEV